MDTLLLEMELTPNCNANCVFCRPVVPMERRSVYLDPGRHNLVVSEFATLPVANKYVVYRGLGEPLLHPRATELVHFTREKLPNSIIHFYTNGIIPSRNLDGASLFWSVSCDTDLIIYDNYDDEVGRRLVKYMQLRGISPDKVRCWDHAAGKYFYNDRAGQPELSKWKRNRLTDPCLCFAKRLFLAAEGYFTLCCQDARHSRKWLGGIKEVTSSSDYLRTKEILGKSRAGMDPCRDCSVMLGLLADPPELPRRLCEQD